MAEEKYRQIDDDDMFLVDDEDEQFQENKYLLFNIGKEIYGINIMAVTDIIELQKITEVPDMPDYIKGVINLRGKVIPVMDLRLRFGMESRAYDDRTCIIIVHVENTSIGFIVDTVSEVKDIRESDIDPPPSFKKHAARDRYISGLGKVDEEVRILLDVKKILEQDEDLKLESIGSEK
ncbi:chemotaxis protein CheW [Marispirochaeta aestuarii]|uniref:chemotaxis protein CheW n=1 Tax=Marispirochaeta aestuarii TaxID=1963862 RepID=UPI0029C92A51|nr:chemotaxis protein CheW [Marispirochaeta aestuarii]